MELCTDHCNTNINCLPSCSSAVNVYILTFKNWESPHNSVGVIIIQAAYTIVDIVPKFIRCHTAFLVVNLQDY